MNAIVCDLAAWMYFASRLPATPLTAFQAQECMDQASATAVCAKAIHTLGWWQNNLAWAYEMLAMPATCVIPLHMLVRPEHRHGRQKGTAIHLFSHRVPDGFLWDIRPPKGLDSLQVVSPAAYLLLNSTRADQVHLAMLTSVLCGDYLCNPNQDNARYFRDALCSRDAITALIGRFEEPTRGVKSLKAVLPYVANGAHSPMETVIQLALSLPTKYGGCGFPVPQLNAKLEVSGELSALLGGSRVIRPDGLWPALRVSYEYDSHQEHDVSPHQIAKDRRRRDVMDRLGYHTVVFDRESCRSELVRNLTFERLATFFNVPFDWSSTAQQRRRDLWNKLRTVGLCW